MTKSEKKVNAHDTARTPHRFNFKAIDQIVEKNIIEPTESKISGKDMISWGDGNAYPNYIMSLVRNVPTLDSAINGLADYVAGNGIVANAPFLQGMDADDLADLVRNTAKSIGRFGGFPWQVIRSEDLTEIKGIYLLNLEWLRSDKENEQFFYSEKFGATGYHRKDKVVIYPKFMAGGEHPSSIYFYKNEEFQTYPSPYFASAVKACEIEKSIDNFHLNAIDNGFTASYLINFNSGVLETDEQMEEVEDEFNEKFSGHYNAGRIGFSWNDSAETKTTIDKVEVEDFGEKYNSLAKRSRQEIFTAFRANPNLFGIPTENTGFSEEEYKSAFKLFNRTIVQPIQKTIIRAMDKVMGMKDSMRIVPFTMEDGEAKVEEA